VKDIVAGDSGSVWWHGVVPSGNKPRQGTVAGRTPNKPLQPTAYSLRYAAASGSG